jgi:hypothetical protein
MIGFVEKRPGFTIAAITAIFVMAYAASLVWLAKPDGRILFGDALHHYVQLRSLVFDRDVRFTNEYLELYGPSAADDPETQWIVEPNATGHVRNLMPVGPALLWAPAFLLVTAAVWIADLLGASYPLDGYGRVFQASAGFSGILAAGIGVWLTYLMASRVVSRRAAIWGTLTIWLASSTLYYSVISPAYSHAASMLTSGAFWFVWIKTRSRDDLGRYAIVGALAGCAALMRWQDMVLVGVPVWDAVRRRGNTATAGAAARIVVAGAAAMLAFLPQMLVWQRLYGDLLTIPQGSSFMQWTSPALWAVLVRKHGLFSWTPAVLLGVVGLVPLARKHRDIAIPVIAFLAVSWYVNAAVSDWWAGEAFGARRFVDCFPLFALATAVLYEQFHEHLRSVITIAIVLTALNGLLLVQYQTFMHGLRSVAPYPEGAYNLWVARFIVPIKLARLWLAR